jgi:hypothetical protein
MIKAWRLFWVTLWSLLISLVFIRNMTKYKDQPILWNVGKSLLDSCIIVLSSIFLSPFLIAMDTAWIVGLIEKKWLKIVVGVISGIVLGAISTVSMEILIIIGIFSVDSKTGPEKGFIHRWRKSEKETFIQQIAA